MRRIYTPTLVITNERRVLVQNVLYLPEGIHSCPGVSRGLRSPHQCVQSRVVIVTAIVQIP